MAELAKRWDIAPPSLLGPLGLSAETLAPPDARLPIVDFVRLVERARELTREQALGFYLGVEMRASAHGYVGLAAMTASTLGEALDLAQRFAVTRTDALSLHMERSTGEAALVVEEHADFGDARDVVLFALLYGIWQIGNALTGKKLEGSADFQMPEPAYFARFAHLAPAVRFNQPSNRLRFDDRLLSLPLLMADPVAKRMAREQCERLLEELASSEDMAVRTKKLISRSDGGVRSLEEVARMMHMSTRTLKRRLAEAGASFSALRDEEQQEAAMRLLERDDLPIERIAEQLGYSDVANFTRAFRRWTAQTPAAYRKSKVSG
ncbi:Transcriptional regulator, AraC family [Labilithrix luteola]|uniref:Transcriptional regulator, AraC family n=1 Tax=Labilithrix luteola TaxID=1391654 RepID=A0A0K1PLT5_9BACT|nr:Transcriptional regulator, AraC family [Labilithrix luteola]